MNAKAIRWKIVVEKNSGHVEMHLRESNFSIEGSKGNHFKQVIKWSNSVTSKGVARPNVPISMMQIELKNITF